MADVINDYTTLRGPKNKRIISTEKLWTRLQKAVDETYDIEAILDACKGIPPDDQQWKSQLNRILYSVLPFFILSPFSDIWGRGSYCLLG